MLGVIKNCLVIVYPLLFIDDSTGPGHEEEGYYYEEEEENFNHLSNQGKLILATLVILINHDQASYTCEITPLTQSQFLLQA